jgi:hypothetical protein
MSNNKASTLFGNPTDAYVASDVKSNERGNPLEFTYRGKSVQVGESFTFRLLSLDKRVVKEVRMRSIKYVVNKKDGGTATIYKSIPAFSDEEIKGKTTPDGEPLSSFPVSTQYRLPVFVYSKTVKDGKSTKVEKVEELRFISVTPTMYTQLLTIPDSETDNDYSFSEDSAKPDYDLKIVAEAGKDKDSVRYRVTVSTSKDSSERYRVTDGEALAPWVEDGTLSKEVRLAVIEAMGYDQSMEYLEEQIKASTSRADDTRPASAVPTGVFSGDDAADEVEDESKPAPKEKKSAAAVKFDFE